MKAPIGFGLLVLTAALCGSAPTAAQADRDFIAVDRFGQLWVLDGKDGCILRNGAGAPLDEINALARRPSDGRLFAAGAWLPGTQAELFEIDPVTGTVGSVVPMYSIAAVTALAFSPAGELFLVEESGGADSLWKVDPQSGATTFIGDLSGYVGIQALCWDSVTQGLLAWDVGQMYCVGAGLVRVDPQTAAVVDVNPNCGLLGDCFTVQGLTVDSAGQVWGVGRYLTRISRVSGCVSWTGACHVGGPQFDALRGLEPYARLELRASGPCPTGISLTLRGGTPAEPAAIGWAPGLTGSVIPRGHCAGTMVDLGPIPRPGVVGALSATGEWVLGPVVVPAAACGGTWVQAVDLASCEVSNPLLL